MEAAKAARAEVRGVTDFPAIRDFLQQTECAWTTDRFRAAWAEYEQAVAISEEMSDEERSVYWNRRWFEACKQLERARELVRRAAPFVNSVAVMAEDKSLSLAWLADAGVEVGTPAPVEADADNASATSRGSSPPVDQETAARGSEGE